MRTVAFTVLLAACTHSPQRTPVASVPTPPLAVVSEQAAQVTLTDFASFANCMPMVVMPGEAPGDPLITVWNLHITGEEAVSIVSAQLTIDALLLKTVLDVRVDRPTLSAESVRENPQVRAVAYEGPRVNACQALCGGDVKTTLNIVIDIAGTRQPLEATGTFSCAM